MYECWAFIQVYDDYPKEWVRGWNTGVNKECGSYRSTNATAFRPEFDMDRVIYVAEEDLCYDRFPKGMCEECLMTGYHKMGCSTQYWEKLK